MSGLHFFTKTIYYCRMQQTKLITFLKTLSKIEWRELELFLRNSQKEKKKVMEFLRLLKKYYPAFDSKKMNKPYFLSKLYPELDGQSGTKKITDLMSILFLDLEDFLIHKEVDLQEEIKDKLLLEVYKRRNLDVPFFKQVEKIEQRIETQKVRGASYYEKKYWINKEEYGHTQSNRRQKAPHKSFLDLIECFDNYYFHERMLYVLEAAHRERMNAVTFEEIFKQDFFELILKTKTPATLKFLLQFYEVTKNRDYKKFETIKLEVINSIDLFHLPFQKLLIRVLKDYASWCCLNKFISSKGLFEVFKLEVDKNLIIDNNDIESRRFVNAITVSCTAKEYTWAENFIQTHGQYLRSEHRENVLSLANANVLFHQKKFEESFKYLIQVKFKTTNDKIVGKALQLRIYYELKEVFALKDFSKATLQYINRNKNLSVEFKENYSFFIKTIDDLVKLRTHRTEAGIDKLKFALSQKKEIYYSNWIYEKFEEISKHL